MKKLCILIAENLSKIGNKVAHKIAKPRPISNENPWNVEAIIILSEKREEIITKWWQVL